MQQRIDVNGRMVATDADGFLLDPAGWTPTIAEAFAHTAGLDPMNDRHWKVISLCREWFARERRRPDLHFVATLSGIGVHDLTALFGQDPLTQIERIAGLPNPSGLAPVDS